MGGEFVPTLMVMMGGALGDGVVGGHVRLGDNHVDWGTRLGSEMR